MVEPEVVTEIEQTAAFDGPADATALVLSHEEAAVVHNAEAPAVELSEL